MQVNELKATFAGLQLDVEGMFMQMPSVDLDELGSQLEAMQQHQQEQVGLLFSVVREHSTAVFLWGAMYEPSKPTSANGKGSFNLPYVRCVFFEVSFCYLPAWKSV